jgi:RND superfamily putative drug exporter
MSSTAGFLTPVDSIAGEQVLEQNFPAASGTPTEVIGRADHLDAMAAAIRGVPNVTEIKPFLDPLAEYDNRQKGIPAPPPKQVDGLVRIRVTLSLPADSPEAVRTVRTIRDLEHKVPGADAQVGGYTASNLDVQDVSGVDRAIVIPLVLLLVFGILVLLLRAVIAPLILIGTVILSYVATLGMCGLVFTHVFGFAGSETSFPMYAFVFLVALGVDYNIFLMTRVREEVAIHGHRAGTLAGLSVTGGVVTSAGIVVAATFAALSVIPLVYLAELAFAVAFGVLLDTLVVRTLLVPALTLDIGRFIWWPSKLRRAEP